MIVVLLLVLWSNTPGMGYAVTLQTFRGEQAVQECVTAQESLNDQLRSIYPSTPVLEATCHWATNLPIR